MSRTWRSTLTFTYALVWPPGGGKRRLRPKPRTRTGFARLREGRARQCERGSNPQASLIGRASRGQSDIQIRNVLDLFACTRFENRVITLFEGVCWRIAREDFYQRAQVRWRPSASTVWVRSSKEARAYSQTPNAMVFEAFYKTFMSVSSRANLVPRLPPRPARGHAHTRFPPPAVITLMTLERSPDLDPPSSSPPQRSSVYVGVVIAGALVGEKVRVAEQPRPRTLREVLCESDRFRSGARPKDLGLFSSHPPIRLTPDDSRANPPPLSFPQVVNNGFDTLWESRNKGKLYKHIVGNFPELEEE